MGQRRRLIWLTVLLWIACGHALAAGPVRCAISQVSAQGSDITAYLEAFNADGQPASSLSSSELSAAIQNEPLKVSQVSSLDSSGEGVAYIFLVDISRSIGAGQFAQIKQAIANWIDGLNSADRMALFTFGSSYKQVAAFTSDKAKLKSVVARLQATDLQTKLYLALYNALGLSRQETAGLPSRRAIVILSDGKDEGSGITEQDVVNQIAQSHTPIYAIGYSRLPMNQKETYLGVLKRLSTLSKGNYEDAVNLKTAYAEMEDTIRDVYVVRLDCVGCQPDAKPHPLELKLGSNGPSCGVIDVNVVAPSAEATSQNPPNQQPGHDGNQDHGNDVWKLILSWKVLLSVAVVIAGSITVVFVVRKPPPEPVTFHPPVTEVVTGTKVVEVAVAFAPGRRIQLTVVAGKERGRTYNLSPTGKSVIGRDRDCDVSFPDDSEMSGHHFQLSLAGSFVEVADLGSTNGTLLNGAELVSSHRVEDGDLVRAGRTELRINIDGAT